MKLTRKQTRPKFWEWILFDKTAFRVLFVMSISMGVVISIALVALFWYIDYKEVALIFGILGVLNIRNAIKYMKNIKLMDSSVNEFVYSNKYTSKNKKSIGKKNKRGKK